MKRDNLITLMTQLIAAYDPDLVVEPGEHVWTTLVDPILTRFAVDPIGVDGKEFVRDFLAARFSDHTYNELSANADAVGIPLEVLSEPLRREILRTQIVQSPGNFNALTDEELEGRFSVHGVPWSKGSKSRVTVRVYFATPRGLVIPFTATAFTDEDLRYFPAEQVSVLPEKMAQYREGSYFYLDVVFEAETEGAAYKIGPEQIVGVTGIDGAISATNKFGADGGENTETRDEYIARVAAVISERAPVTKPGILGKVEDLVGSLGVYTVGYGDTHMYRDIATWTYVGSLTKELATGVGEMVQHNPVGIGEGETYTFPYARGISGVNIFQSYLTSGAVKIALSGGEYDILTLTEDQSTFESYAAPGDDDYGGAGTIPNSLPVQGGADIPHPYGLKQVGVSFADVTTKVCYVKDHDAAEDGIQTVYGAWNEGGESIILLAPRPLVLQTDDAGTKLITVTKDGDNFLVTPKDGEEWNWSSGAPIVEGDLVAFEVDDEGDVQKYELQITLYSAGTLYGIDVGEEDPLPEVGFTTDDADHFTVYRSYGLYDGPGQAADPPTNLGWVAVYLYVDYTYLPPYIAGDHLWSLRGPLTSADFDAILTLVDGTEISVDGDIEIGGCTDVYVVGTESPATAVSDIISDSNEVTSGLNAEIKDTESYVYLSLSDLQKTRVDDVIFLPALDGPAENTYFAKIVKYVDETNLRVRVDHTFEMDAEDLEFSVHRDHEVQMWNNVDLKDQGSDLKIGFSSVVLVQGGIPSTVLINQTLEITAGTASGKYNIEKIVGAKLTLDASPGFAASGVSYKIYDEDPAVTGPIGDLGTMELMQGMSNTSIYLDYAVPLLARAIQNSVTDGNDTKLPNDMVTGCSGGIVEYPVESGEYVLFWNRSFLDHGVTEGDVLMLRGETNYGVAYVTEVSHIGSVLTETVLKFAPVAGSFEPNVEEFVPFEIYSPHVTTLRLYFETPVQFRAGFWSNSRYTSFTSGTKTYIPHPEVTQSIETDVGVEFMLKTADDDSQGRVYEPSAVGEFKLFDFWGDDIYRVSVISRAMDSDDLDNTVDVAGKTIKFKVGGYPSGGTTDAPVQTLMFKGANPVPLDSADPLGVKQQLEAGFGFIVKIIDGDAPGKKKIRIMHDDNIVIPTADGGTAVTDLGFAVGENNFGFSEYHLTYDVVGLEDEEQALLIQPVGDAEMPDFPPSQDGPFVCKLERKGTKLLTKDEMELNTEFGMYYIDLEVKSVGGGAAYAVTEDEQFTIGGYYHYVGYGVSSIKGLSFGTAEKLTFKPSCLAVTPLGTSIATAAYGYAFNYNSVPIVSALQTLLDHEDNRATCDSLMVKQKPKMRVGVGPVTAPTSVTQAQVATRLGNVLAKFTSGQSLDVSEVMGILNSMGVKATTETRIILIYEDLDRVKKADLVTEMTYSQLWQVVVDPDLVVFTV